MLTRYVVQYIPHQDDRMHVSTYCDVHAEVDVVVLCDCVTSFVMDGCMRDDMMSWVIDNVMSFCDGYVCMIV
jgi:hypothetical protein